ncbi:O-antigen ligase family protein [Neobacillus mesonae]|uniref:O-antigen ligase-related domain-containing protein n=1 Tax=Neobacillus mesonae TaxID=1193713 RepID=A0A3Q9QVY3_9BACI|nr:O-antigen ligase family protein [Neobacillus mesonae]AZU64482.1 hypothetical protein CHR53_26440 [Neobacillus mesonae]
MENNSFKSYSNQKYTIKKSTLEWVIIICLIIFSCINTSTMFISMLLFLAFLIQKELGALKIINIITLRTVINPGLGIDIGNQQNLKWIILFLCSIYLLFSYSKLKKCDKRKINLVINIVLLFTTYNIFVAFVFSSLPIVAIIKLLSYTIIFLGTLIGVGYTYRKIDWLKWMLSLFTIMMACSFIFLPLPVSRLRNGVSFQGIINHPNMFGILAVFFVATVLSYSQINKNFKKVYLYSSLILVLYMVILSKSRTSLISCILLILLYVLFSNYKTVVKFIILPFSIIGVIFLALGSNISEFLIKFLYKGQGQGELLNSRIGQIESLTSNFKNSPWFGNGFSVPVLPFKSYVFSFDYVVEPGNLILSVLSYSGVIGFFIFITYIFIALWKNIKNFKKIGFLPVATLIISMGEMVFFSSNNIGIWCYMFLSMYLFFNNRK